MTSEAAEPTRAPELLRRPWAAALIVLAVYAVLAVANSTDGYLGTDTGAKVITLDHMVERGTLSPDVGYWAAEWDEDGTYHPLLDTVQNDDGEWINVTTLPMLVAAWPLYAVGGYRLALFLPMFGALLAAFAVRDVARQLGDEEAGWTAYWLTALGSPIAIYALDLWEHSLGAGLMVGAFALLLRLFRDDRRWWLPVLAGLALGASASMRTETFVAAFVFVAATCAVQVARHRWAWGVACGALAVVGFAAPWLADAALEDALGGSSRTDRAAGVVGADRWAELGTRMEEAATTWFGLPAAAYPGNALLGLMAIGSLVLAALLVRRGERRAAAVALVIVAFAYLVGLSGGLAFVSGAFLTAPVAALLVTRRGWDPASRFTLAVALVTTVLIWLFQFTGGAGPQWGGRYILATTLLLLALGAVALNRLDQSMRAYAVGLSAVVAILGFVWLGQRSHDVDRFFDDLAQRPEDVIISTNGFLVREAGPAYDDHRYLSVGRQGDLEGAMEVARRAGAGHVGVLTEASRTPDVDGRPAGRTQVEFLGVPMFIHSFRLDG